MFTYTLIGKAEGTGYHHDVYHCPPWFFFNSKTNRCQCYDDTQAPPKEAIQCTEDGALMRIGYCMTFTTYNQTFIVACPFFQYQFYNVTESLYIKPPDNLIELNEYMCGPLKRKDLLCRECIEGFGPSLTSYHYECSNCTGVWYGVPLYLVLELVPVTIFYLIILTFQIKVTSAPMTCFIMYSQLVVYNILILTP